jgi:hypothetical protein
MTVAGIIAVVVGSARLRRTAPEVLAQATRIAAQHELQPERQLVHL